MEQLYEKLHAYIHYPEVTKLLNSRINSDGTNPDRHSQHVIEGYKLINDYKSGQDPNILKEAIRMFKRIQNTDMKYLQALALYGEAIAYGMEDKYKEANDAIAQLKGLGTSFGTDYSDEIEDLKHYALAEMAADLKEEHKRLHPHENEVQPSGCVVFILIFITSSLLMFL